MGEYAKRKSDGAEVKIGTCESMYYLRFDQRHLVAPIRGNVDPVKDQLKIRYRFPFPSEDQVAPGEFEDYNRGYRVQGAKVPAEVEHYTVQFTARAGYVMSLPCPESQKIEPGSPLAAVYHLIHRNGFNGHVEIKFQRPFNGMLVTICECHACGTLYRLETLEMAKTITDLLRKEADDCSPAVWGADHCRADAEKERTIRAIIERIEAGYQTGILEHELTR